MKPMSFTLRVLLFSLSLLVMISCTKKTPTEATHNEAPQKETIPDKTGTVNEQDKGAAHFEAGLKAADANNMPLAFKEFLEAAKAGNDFAQYNVALMYEQGLGVEKNEKDAFSWYEKSAAQGNSAAQFNLGVLYENGVGTSVDFAKANEWYRKASVQGDGLAIGNLGMLYIRGDGVQENKIAGVALLLMSTTMDNSPENRAKENISATRGLTVEMVTEAQALSDKMSNAQNLLVPLDNYLKN